MLPVDVMEVVGALLLGVVVVIGQVAGVEYTYHTHEQLLNYLTVVNHNFPDITHVYSIGKSKQGRDLRVIAIGKSPNEHVRLRPDVKLIANIHGNEAVGREVLIQLIDYLTTRYSWDSRVRGLVDKTRIHVLVTMNPDGYLIARNEPQEGHCQPPQSIGRWNIDGFDLNRNFPDYFSTNPQPIQPETQVIMDWLTKYQFVLSVSLHGGAMVVNYPYDTYPGAEKLTNPRPRYSRSPDDDVFRHLALTYSWAHPVLHNTSNCGESFEFGISNGADWYPVTGGMQDYNYIVGGCLEMTIEISCCKYPSRDQLVHYWNQNKEPLLRFIEKAHIGVKGMVVDINDSPVGGAQVTIEGRKHPVHTTSQGEYWKILLPGAYTIKVSSPGYETDIQQFQVRFGRPTVLRHKLQPQTQTRARKEPPKEEKEENNSSLKLSGSKLFVTPFLIYVVLFWCFPH